MTLEVHRRVAAFLLGILTGLLISAATELMSRQGWPRMLAWSDAAIAIDHADNGIRCAMAWEGGRYEVDWAARADGHCYVADAPRMSR